MWCITSAPLLISANLNQVDPYALETWGNEEAIYVNPAHPRAGLLELDQNPAFRCRKDGGAPPFDGGCDERGAEASSASRGACSQQTTLSASRITTSTAQYTCRLSAIEHARSLMINLIDLHQPGQHTLAPWLM